MSTSPFAILVVEDDADIRVLVGDLLSRQGYDVTLAIDAVSMDASLMRSRADLIILDVMLPGEDGLSICRRLRQSDATPILMLTARADEVDKVLGLEFGADDYLTKPFGPRELIARCRALLRRGQGAPADATSRRFAFDRFIADLDSRRVEAADGNEALVLTSSEFDLLACFIQRPRRVLNRDQILDALKGRAADPLDRSVDMLVSRLRRKLDSAAPEAALISTVRNGGYLFTPLVKRVR